MVKLSKDCIEKILWDITALHVPLEVTLNSNYVVRESEKYRG